MESGQPRFLRDQSRQAAGRRGSMLEYEGQLTTTATAYCQLPTAYCQLPSVNYPCHYSPSLSYPLRNSLDQAWKRPSRMACRIRAIRRR